MTSLDVYIVVFPRHCVAAGAPSNLGFLQLERRLCLCESARPITVVTSERENQAIFFAPVIVGSCDETPASHSGGFRLLLGAP